MVPSVPSAARWFGDSAGGRLVVAPGLRHCVAGRPVECYSLRGRLAQRDGEDDAGAGSLPDLAVGDADPDLALDPLSVQIARGHLQSVVSGRVTVSEPVPLGRTVSFQPRLLPCIFRDALLMLSPLTRKARWTSRCRCRAPRLASGRSRNRSRCARQPRSRSWPSGTAPPARTADRRRWPTGCCSVWKGFSSFEQMAPVVPQPRFPGSVIVTASLPSGSMVIGSWFPPRHGRGLR